MPAKQNPPRICRWTINGDFVALAPNGVARYAREVTRALDNLVAVSAADVQRVAQEWFTRKRQTAGWYLPE